MNRKTTLIFAFSSILSLSTFSQDVLQINNLCKVRQRTKFNSSNTNSYSPNDNILKNHKYDLGEMRKDDLIGVLAFLKNSSKNEIKSIYEFSNTITCAASKNYRSNNFLYHNRQSYVLTRKKLCLRYYKECL